MTDLFNHRECLVYNNKNGFDSRYRKYDTGHDGTGQDWTVLHGSVSLSVLSRVGEGE